MSDDDKCYVNTDREIYRGPSRAEWGDADRFYADSIHVTEGGGIGFNCGGHVIVMPLRKWFEAAQAELRHQSGKKPEGGPASLDEVVQLLESARADEAAHPDYNSALDYALGLLRPLRHQVGQQPKCEHEWLEGVCVRCGYCIRCSRTVAGKKP